MAAADPDDLLATGSAALAAGKWAGARAAFEDALAREPTAEAHAGLADVLWWVGETQASVQHHERAYAAFRHRDDLPNAAMGAVGLYRWVRGDASIDVLLPDGIGERAGAGLLGATSAVNSARPCDWRREHRRDGGPHRGPSARETSALAAAKERVRESRRRC